MHADGSLVATPQELAEQARQQAEQAQRQAEQERQRAEHAEQLLAATAGDLDDTGDG